MEAKFAYVNVANSTRKSVFSVFLKLHPRDKDNAWLNLWLKDIPTAVNGTTKIAAKTNFLELLSFETPFWYYEGSQVHPPCTETVDWFISMRPKFVSTRQVHPLRRGGQLIHLHAPQVRLHSPSACCWVLGGGGGEVMSREYVEVQWQRFSTRANA
ncbi:unnamed protein product [Closterium sp. NIES-54]